MGASQSMQSTGSCIRFNTAKAHEATTTVHPEIQRGHQSVGILQEAPHATPYPNGAFGAATDILVRLFILGISILRLHYKNSFQQSYDTHNNKESADKNNSVGQMKERQKRTLFPAQLKTSQGGVR